MKIPRPPGPSDRFLGLPLMRHMQRDFVGFWREAQQRYGDAIHMRVMGLDYYGFTHPEQIREVLVEKADSFIRFERPIQVMSQLQGQSLLITEGEVWRKQRRTLLPCFSAKRFPAYARQITEAIDERLAGLPGDGATSVDFEREMNLLAIDIIVRTTFGAGAGVDAAQIEHAVRVLGKIAYEEMFYPASLPDWLPLPYKREKRRNSRLLDNLVWSQIHARRAAPEPGDDLLGMLLSATDDEGDGAALSDRELRDQLITIFIAGHETTAAALAWAGWALASHPDIASAAAEEVDRVLGGVAPTFADVARLPYLGMVIKESLRRYPPTPGVFTRRATADVQIGQWLVPKGSLVTTLSVLPQHDERWFAQPERFDPSRFAANAPPIERGAYFPFGTGPRVCIGQGVAVMQMSLTLAMLLQRFTLRPAPGQHEPQVRAQVTLRPRDRLHLALQRRACTATAAPTPHEGRSDHRCPFHA